MRMTGLATAVALILTASAAPRAQAPPSPSLEGAWTLNKDLSDKPPAGREGGQGREGHQGGHRGGGGRGGAGHGGGFGGAGSGGGQAQGQGGNAEDVQRLRNALRDELEAPEHLTIVESGSTIILTAGDGRTTRLSADGKKVKDESTKVDRRTKWDAGKLVSEVSGLGQGKIVETYTLDAEHKQLRVTLNIEGAQQKTTVNRVYDADPR